VEGRGGGGDGNRQWSGWALSSFLTSGDAVTVLRQSVEVPVADRLEWSPHQEGVSKKETPAINRRESDGVVRLLTVHNACQIQRHLV